jgi:hypothetical protein
MPWASVGISGVCSEELGNHLRLACTVPFKFRFVSEVRGHQWRVKESLWLIFRQFRDGTPYIP